LNAFYFSSLSLVKPIFSVIYRFRSVLSNFTIISEFFTYLLLLLGRLFISSLKPVFVRPETRLSRWRLPGLPGVFGCCGPKVASLEKWFPVSKKPEFPRLNCISVISPCLLLLGAKELGEKSPS
jgi:hypothetical protein